MNFLLTFILLFLLNTDVFGLAGPSMFVEKYYLQGLDHFESQTKELGFCNITSWQLDKNKNIHRFIFRSGDELKIKELEDRGLLKKIEENTYFSILDQSQIEAILNNPSNYFIPFSDSQLSVLLPQDEVFFETFLGGISLKAKKNIKLLKYLQKILPADVYKNFSKKVKDQPLVSVHFLFGSRLSVLGQMQTMVPAPIARLLSFENEGIKLDDSEYRFVAVIKDPSAMQVGRYNQEIERIAKFSEEFERANNLILQAYFRVNKPTDLSLHKMHIQKTVEEIKVKLLEKLNRDLSSYGKILYMKGYFEGKLDDLIKKIMLVNSQEELKVLWVELNQCLTEIHKQAEEDYSKLIDDLGVDAPTAKILSFSAMGTNKEFLITDVTNEINFDKSYGSNIDIFIRYFLTQPLFFNYSSVKVKIIGSRVEIHQTMGDHIGVIEINLEHPQEGGKLRFYYNEGGEDKGNERRAALVACSLESLGFRRISKSEELCQIEYQYDKDSGAIDLKDIIDRFFMLERLTQNLSNFCSRCKSLCYMRYEILLKKFYEFYPRLGDIKPELLLPYRINEEGRYVQKDGTDFMEQINVATQEISLKMNGLIDSIGIPVSTKLSENFGVLDLEHFFSELTSQKNKGILKEGNPDSPIRRDRNRELPNPVVFFNELLGMEYCDIEKYDITDIAQFIFSERKELMSCFEKVGKIENCCLYQLSIKLYPQRNSIYCLFDATNTKILFAFVVEGEGIHKRINSRNFHDTLLSREDFVRILRINFINGFSEERLSSIGNHEFKRIEGILRLVDPKKKFSPSLDELLELPYLTVLPVGAGQRIWARSLYRGSRSSLAFKDSLLVDKQLTIEPGDLEYVFDASAALLTHGGPLTHSAALMKDAGCVGVVANQGVWVLKDGRHYLLTTFKNGEKKEKVVSGRKLEYFEEEYEQKVIEEEMIFLVDGIDGKVFLFGKSIDLLRVYSSLRNINYGINVNEEIHKLLNFLENTQEENVIKYVLSFVFLNDFISLDIINNMPLIFDAINKNKKVNASELLNIFMNKIKKFYIDLIKNNLNIIESSENFYEMEYFYCQTKSILEKCRAYNLNAAGLNIDDIELKMKKLVLFLLTKKNFQSQNRNFQEQINFLKNVKILFEDVCTVKHLELERRINEMEAVFRVEEVPSFYMVRDREASVSYSVLIGKKAAGLTTIENTPKWFSITTRAVEEIIAYSHLADLNFEEKLRRLKEESKDSETFATSVARELLKIPEPIKAEILRYYGELGVNVSVAVRSSCTKEDEEDQSFAGQYESYLNVYGEDDVLFCVKKVISSLWNYRINKYMTVTGKEDFGMMSVLIQEMVPDVVAAGVASNIDFSTHDYRVVKIQGGLGLGEGIVEDKVSTDVFDLDKNTGEVKNQKIALKDKQVIAEPEGGTRLLQLSCPISKPVLNASQLMNLFLKIKEIEVFYNGKPLDIEWALSANGNIYILQCRPLTGIKYEKLKQKDDRQKKSDELISLLRLKTSDQEAEKVLNEMVLDPRKYDRVIVSFIQACFARSSQYKADRHLPLVRFAMIMQTGIYEWQKELMDAFFYHMSKNWNFTSREILLFATEYKNKIVPYFISKMLKEDERGFAGILKNIMPVIDIQSLKLCEKELLRNFLKRLNKIYSFQYHYFGSTFPEIFDRFLNYLKQDQIIGEMLREIEDLEPMEIHYDSASVLGEECYNMDAIKMFICGDNVRIQKGEIVFFDRGKFLVLGPYETNIVGKLPGIVKRCVEFSPDFAPTRRVGRLFRKALEILETAA